MKRLHMWILVFGFAITVVRGNPVAQDVDKSANEIEGSTSDPYMTALAKCSSDEGITGIINCAASRTLKVLEWATKTKSIELLPGIALVSENPQIQREGKSLADIQLPENPKQRAEKLLNMIVDAAGRFLSGRTLNIKLPEVASMNIARAIEEERGKKKKHMSPLLLLLGAKLLLVKKLMILALGFISTKALVISVIALVLAVFAGGSSLFSGVGGGLKNIGGPFGGGGHGFISGWSTGGGYGPSYGNGNSYNPGWTTNNIGGGWGNSQYPYARSIDVKDNSDDSKVEAQDLAYSRQKP